MNLIRSIKINKLGIAIPEKDKEIIDFIKSILGDLIPFKFDNYPLSIFYMSSNGKWILEQDNKNDRLWVRYDIVWEILEEKYLIEYDDIQTLLKYMIEQAFKEKVSTPFLDKVTVYLKVEQAFKEKVSTPESTSFDKLYLVEQAFKHTVSTPDMSREGKNPQIEQSYIKKINKI